VPQTPPQLNTSINGQRVRRLPPLVLLMCRAGQVVRDRRSPGHSSSGPEGKSEFRRIDPLLHCLLEDAFTKLGGEASDPFFAAGNPERR